MHACNTLIQGNEMKGKNIPTSKISDHNLALQRNRRSKMRLCVNHLFDTNILSGTILGIFNIQNLHITTLSPMRHRRLKLSAEFNSQCATIYSDSCHDYTIWHRRTILKIFHFWSSHWFKRGIIRHNYATFYSTSVDLTSPKQHQYRDISVQNIQFGTLPYEESNVKLVYNFG